MLLTFLAAVVAVASALWQGVAAGTVAGHWLEEARRTNRPKVSPHNEESEPLTK